MANTVQIKRGSTASVNAHTGPSGEIIYNLDTGRLHAQDGSTAGGNPHALISDVDLKANAATQVIAGDGLTGGGTLDANRTLALSSASIASLAKADSSVQTVNGIAPTGGNVSVSAEEVRLQDSRSSAILESFAGSVNFVQTAGYYAAGDGGGALYKRVSSEPSHAGKFQSADGAWWELADDVINIRALGAKADSTGVGIGTDTSPILAAAIDCGKALRKNIYIPAGGYRLSTRVSYDKSTLNASSAYIPSIFGDGIAMTRLYCTEGGVFLSGSLVPGLYVSWIEVSDICFKGNGVGTGLGAENIGFLRYKRIACSEFAYGCVMKGVISSKLEQPYLSGNEVGLSCLATDDLSWSPNAISVDQPWIANNKRLGINLQYPATFNIRGGSVEGNGQDTSFGVNQRGGMHVAYAGQGGHAAIISDGVYYEYNSGIADILFLGSSREVASSLSGNTFTRMGTNPTNTCIAVYSVTHKFSLSLDGNGFGELGSGATPSGKYLDIEANPLVRVSERGNTYQNVTYAPSFANVMADCEQTRPIAMGYVAANGALSGTGVNVASVTKIAAGQYKINLASPVAGRKFALTQPGSARMTYNLSFDATSVTVGFTNLAGVDTDTEFGFVAYATAIR